MKDRTPDNGLLGQLIIYHHIIIGEGGGNSGGFIDL